MNKIVGKCVLVMSIVIVAGCSSCPLTAADEESEAASALELEREPEEASFRSDHESDHPSYEEQLREWLGNMGNEFRILEEMADKPLRMIRGEDIEERGGMWKDPPNLRDTVLMTVDENFDEFWVWVAWAEGEICEDS